MEQWQKHAFYKFSNGKRYFLWILSFENTDSDTKRSEMITGHGSIVSTNDKKSKSRFGFDMTIPYYSNLIKAVQSTTTYDNDNIRKNIWNISFRCTGVTFQHHLFRFLKSWEFHQKKKFYPCIWTATIWNFWAQTYYFTTVWRHESCKESEIIRLRGVYNFSAKSLPNRFEMWWYMLQTECSYRMQQTICSICH